MSDRILQKLEPVRRRQLGLEVLRYAAMGLLASSLLGVGLGAWRWQGAGAALRPWGQSGRHGPLGWPGLEGRLWACCGAGLPAATAAAVDQRNMASKIEFFRPSISSGAVSRPRFTHSRSPMPNIT